MRLHGFFAGVFHVSRDKEQGYPEYTRKVIVITTTRQSPPKKLNTHL